jgi:Flp pilus assembly protein, secretin CpaC
LPCGSCSWTSTGKLRQAGITFNSPVKWSLSFNKIAEYFSIGEGNQGAHLDSITGTINILQNKKIAKVVYENQLSTLSGEKAQFQEGGVLNVKIYSQYNTDLKEIEYGFQVAATPYTIDDETIAVDFDMSQLRPKNQNAWTSTDSDKDLSKYMTKSKYTMAAGSGKVISSIIMNGESLSSSGLPWLADLPWVGSWLFGSTSRGANEHELLLILHVDWEDAEVRERELVFQQKKQKAEDVRKESRSALKEAGL